MKVSYAITVVDEYPELQQLVEHLLKFKRKEDEIVILWDDSRKSKLIEEYLRSHSINAEFNWHQATFNNHFADWKNKLTALCSGDYIFQIDADEIPDEALIQMLPAILETNPQVEVYLVPRINKVIGLTQAHIDKWRWNVDAEGRVNFPDYQWRIYRKMSTVTWANKVHERLIGHQNYAFLPAENTFCLYHIKSIEKQEKQNNYYDTL